MINALVNNNTLFLWIVIFISHFFGAFIAYFTVHSRKTLYRIPYLFIYGIIFVVFALIIYAIQVLTIRNLTTQYLYEHNISSSNQLLLPFILFICAVCVFGYFTMRISIPRAYDGFGSKKAAWLLIVPIFFYGLFIVTLDDDPDDPEPTIERNPIRTPAFMNGAKGLVYGSILYLFSYGMLIYIGQ